MISYRKRQPPDVIRVIAAWPSAIRGHELSDREMQTLCVLHVLQQDKNNFPSTREVANIMGVIEIVSGGVLRKLAANGYVERVGGINVTEKGEYAVRGLSVILSRIINGQKLSRWKPAKPDQKLYLRRAARKGNKITK